MQQTKRIGSLKTDHAIQTRINVLILIIQIEDKFRQSDLYDRKMKVIGVASNWFESQQKLEVKNTKKLNDKRIMNELVLTIKEIKLRRFYRLKELYENEADMYDYLKQV